MGRGCLAVPVPAAGRGRAQAGAPPSSLPNAFGGEREEVEP